MSYKYGGQNSFIKHEEEVDDLTFLNHPQQGSSGYLLGTDVSLGHNQSIAEKRKQILEERRKIQERTLEATKESLGHMYEAESIGNSAAQNLLIQRGKLENTEKNLDVINGLTRQSQKSLNAMSSVFNSFLSIFKKDTPHQISANPITEYRSSKTSLSSTLDKNLIDGNAARAQNHPALSHRGLKFDDNPIKTQNQISNFTGYDERSIQIENQLDENLDEIANGISRLKSLASGLSEELDEQNEMLPRIAMKAERARDTITYQNRQIKKLL